MFALGVFDLFQNIFTDSMEVEKVCSHTERQTCCGYARNGHVEAVCWMLDAGGRISRAARRGSCIGPQARGLLLDDCQHGLVGAGHSTCGFAVVGCVEEDLVDVVDDTIVCEHVSAHDVGRDAAVGASSRYRDLQGADALVVGQRERQASRGDD